MPIGPADPSYLGSLIGEGSIRSRRLEPLCISHPLNVFPKFQQAVAEFGLLLKNSSYKGSTSFGDVIAAARASLGGDPDGYRAEFLRLATAAQSLGLARTEEPR